MRRLLIVLSSFLLTGLTLAFEQVKAPAFTELLIADKYGYAFGVAAADLDGDGDVDRTSCDTTNNVLYWFENDGKKGFDKEWKRHVIDENLAETRTIRVADFNGDKRLDEIATAERGSNELRWWRNEGKRK